MEHIIKIKKGQDKRYPLEPIEVISRVDLGIGEASVRQQYSFRARELDGHYLLEKLTQVHRGFPDSTRTPFGIEDITDETKSTVQQRLHKAALKQANQLKTPETTIEDLTGF